MDGFLEVSFSKQLRTPEGSCGEYRVCGCSHCQRLSISVPRVILDEVGVAVLVWDESHRDEPHPREAANG